MKHRQDVLTQQWTHVVYISSTRSHKCATVHVYPRAISCLPNFFLQAGTLGVLLELAQFTNSKLPSISKQWRFDCCDHLDTSDATLAMATTALQQQAVLSETDIMGGLTAYAQDPASNWSELGFVDEPGFKFDKEEHYKAQQLLQAMQAACGPARGTRSQTDHSMDADTPQHAGHRKKVNLVHHRTLTKMYTTNDTDRTAALNLMMLSPTEDCTKLEKVLPGEACLHNCSQRNVRCLCVS